MSIIIGIDHGYYAIKTAHCSFPAGLTSYGEHEPYTRQGLLEFGGCFFVCGTGRQPIQRDKTVNDNYYLLTLAAIAMEIRQRGLPPECSVRIAAGLPLTSFGRDKPKFRDYLLRSNQPVNYKFEGVEYSITIEEVAIFPQGYAALMTETGLAANFTDEVAAQINGILHDIQTGESTKPNLQEQLEQTQQEFDRLLEMSLDFDENTPFLDDKLKKLNNKIKSLKKAIEDSAARQEKARQPEMLLSAKDLQIQEYDDALTARIIEKITVRSRNEIEIRFIGGYKKTMQLT